MTDRTEARCTRRRLLQAALGTAAGAMILDAGAARAQTAMNNSSPNAVFPVSSMAGQRYLKDATGQPFFIHGDTAWSLIAQLTREKVEKYLNDRQKRGFNAILANLLEHHFTSYPQANAYRQQSFLKPGDFTTPNEDYFSHADWVLRQAAQRDILVLLAPAYVGYSGSDQGWYEKMVANGPDKLRAYGRYLGQRYREFSNILWVHGGDWNPPRKDLVQAIVDGIREHDTRALHTAHCAPETAAIEYWARERWLQVNNVYTYNSVYAAAIKEYLSPRQLPFFLIESAYENEHRAGELRVRVQAYHALLSGACGHVYGNNPIWHFDGPGLFPAPTSWEAALASRGAESMTHLRALFLTIPWWRLVPDTRGSLLTAGVGAAQDRAAAAMTDDGSVALAYLPSPRPVRIDLKQLQGRTVRVRWFNPATGHYVLADGESVLPAEAQLFVPPPSDGGAAQDWVLVLQAAS